MVTLVVIRKLYGLLVAADKIRLARVLGLVFVMAIFDAIGVASLMPFLAVVGDSDVITQNHFLNQLYVASSVVGVSDTANFLVLLGVCSFVILCLSATYRTLTEYILNKFIEDLRHSISSRLLKNYLEQPYEYFMGRNSSDLTKTVLSEIDQLVGTVIRPTILMIVYLIVASCIVVLLLYLYPLILILSITLFGSAYAITFSLIKPRLDELGNRRTESNKNRFRLVLEVLNGIKDVRLLGFEKNYLHRYHAASEQLAVALSTNQTLNKVPKYIIEALAFGGIITMVLLLIVAEGGVDGDALGTVLPLVGVFAFAAYRLQPAMHFIFTGLSSLRFGKTAVEKIFEDFYSYPVDPPYASDKSRPMKILREIKVKDLTFTYHSAKNPALKDISFNLPAGNVLGIVGGTGCGKTTLINLILRLLSPSSGSITVDGVEINSENARSWQRTIGCVSQDIYLTDNSLSENIAFGLPLSEIDQERVEECAALANIHAFISDSLPDGYSTIVGERGVRLSGGQRQRIGIARALYHDPKVLVFDEATSALDTLVEKAIMEAIDKLSYDRTIIIVAHRMSTIRKCDNILLLADGNVEASGTFNELMQTSPTFKKMNEAYLEKED